MKTKILAALLIVLLASVVSGTKDPKKPAQCALENAAIDKLKEILNVVTSEPVGPVTAYPTDVFEFPKDGSGDTAVKYLDVVPNFNPAMTLCFWAQFEDFSEITPVIRLVNNDNKILFSIETHPPATVRVSDGVLKIVYPMKLRTSYPYQFCIYLNPETKLAGTYLNGEHIGAVPSEHVTLDDGNNDRTLLIGGKNSGAQFKGYISNFVGYDRALSKIEIQQMAYNCQRPIDDVLFTSLEKVELLGDARYQSDVVCPSRASSFNHWLKQFYN